MMTNIRVNNKFVTNFYYLLHFILILLTIFLIYKVSLSYIFIFFINILLFFVKDTSFILSLAKLWFALGVILQYLVSPIILFLIFFLFLFPFSLFLKILRIKFLNIHSKQKNKSYWDQCLIHYDFNFFKDQF